MNSNSSILHDSQLKGALLQRGDNASKIALRDLKRYYALLKRSLSELSFSIGEAALICDALKGYNLEDNLARIETVLPWIHEAIQRDSFDRKWKVNREVLANKLKALYPFQTLALVDAVEQFWVKQQSNPNQKIQEILLQVDLLHCCDFAL
ncbi:hypothetical protein IQ238_13990 [Pleurocapsales cyanobacterium LEGE 06147]|nr:hypothetical protein [Pleurocapsales cyanobacterium LEGE 06147]